MSRFSQVSSTSLWKSSTIAQQQAEGVVLQFSCVTGPKRVSSPRAGPLLPLVDQPMGESDVGRRLHAFCA
jgi:hypothetical protein